MSESLSNRDPVSRKLEAPMQPFLGNKLASTVKYYYSTQNQRMIRSDGIVIHFVQGVHKSSVLPTQQHLDSEIENDHPYLRYATEQEIEAYEMNVDPKGTISRQLRPQLEAEITAQLERDLREKLKEHAANGEFNLTEEQLEVLFGKKEDVFSENALAGVGNDKENIPVIQSGTAKLQMLAESRQTSLGGISGTDKLAGGAADSNSGGV